MVLRVPVKMLAHPGAPLADVTMCLCVSEGLEALGWSLVQGSGGAWGGS